MIKERKIYERNSLYTFLRPYVDRCIKSCYRRVQVDGEENIPSDGAVILTPNHCNTLMDALVMLRAYKGETVFGARADLFKKPAIARIMFFLRILPMVRQRDGLRNVLKNHETQETIVETLENDVRFCVYPEGRHRPAKSLLPLGKGVFRAALAANARFGDRKPVYIVPVGLEYGDFFRFRSTSLVSYGQPVDVTGFVKERPDSSEAQIIDALRKELATRMSGLFSYIKDDDLLQKKWNLTRMAAIAEYPKGYGSCGTRLDEHMHRNREIIARIEKACEEKPEDMQDLLEEVADFERNRRRNGISIYSFGKKRYGTAYMILKSFAAIICLPYFLFCAIVNLPMWSAYCIIRSRIKDRAFHNTVGLGIRLALCTILFPTYAVIAFCLLTWPAALAFTIVLPPSFGFFFDYTEGMRRLISDIRILKCKKLKKQFDNILEKGKTICL